jgi:hypothetical protein
MFITSFQRGSVSQVEGAWATEFEPNRFHETLPQCLAAPEEGVSTWKTIQRVWLFPP